MYVRKASSQLSQVIKMTELLDKNYNNELTAPANNTEHTAFGCVQNVPVNHINNRLSLILKNVQTQHKQI